MCVNPHKVRRTGRVLLNLLTIGLIIAMVAWLDAEAEAPHRSATGSGVSRLVRERLDAIRRGVAVGVPPRARSHAIAAMKAMPMLNAAAGTWTFAGPDSITNGEGLSTAGTCGAPARITVTGRISAIA